MTADGAASEPIGSWVVNLSRVKFDRPFDFGRATFRPAGEIQAEVKRRRALVDESKTGHLLRWEQAMETAEQFDSATVEVRAANLGEARVVLAEAMAALRFLMREIVSVNTDFHRIGIAGEVDLQVLDYLVLGDNGIVAPGWSLEDTPIQFRFTNKTLDMWGSDDRVRWLGDELGRNEESRTEAGRRAITALGVADRAFLARDPLTRIMFSALAVEAMFASGQEFADGQAAAVQVARRVAYLTCGHDADEPLCPYVGDLDRQKHVVALAKGWASADRPWRCSPFLDICTPDELAPYMTRMSLFSARNEVAHEGRTSADEKTVKDLRWRADQALAAGIAWFAQHPGGTITDLEAEIQNEIAARGVLRPEDVPVEL